ncbi:LLM class flavin-dependent oxidoreductase [Pseudonocardia sp. H11422]|uniref:LLM class flavin-dependent oxidoreductase n=1 Tax=Pseudonocardia sp. H11422 TaxID=2835866 RepID=UPI001BDCA4BF|nr:LLM class flavin-dependent oxidoreductase [Pseudonocardia sp. H11422]
MKFNLFMLPTVPATFEERERLRPIGRNKEKYQQMLEEVRTLAVMADEAGFDALSTTEHHFHSEGFEASVAPLLLYADLAARTKRIKFAPMALVLPSWDPLRLAEEMAVLDHLTQGRLYSGFARGYQDRWTNVLGQHYHVTGAPMDGSEVDNHNRAVFEEVHKIVKMAWTQETVEYNSEYYSIPQPYKEGITRWPAAEWTRKYGAPGEIDENGVIRRICVIPAPYQDPYPPSFQPFSVSAKTIEYTAAQGITPFILTSYPPDFARLCETYQKVAAENGRQLGLGQGVGAFRSVHFGDTEQEAVELMTRTNYEGFRIYFSGFGFWEAFRTPEDDAKYPRDPDNYVALPPEEWTVERFRKVKYGIAGTVDQVLRDIEDLATIHQSAGGELEWFSWFFDQGFMSFDESRRQMEIFAEKVIPRFT